MNSPVSRHLLVCCVLSMLPACEKKRNLDAALVAANLELSEVSDQRRKMQAELSESGRTLAKDSNKVLSGWKKSDIADQIAALQRELDVAQAQEQTATAAAAAAKRRLDTYVRTFVTP